MNMIERNTHSATQPNPKAQQFAGCQVAHAVMGYSAVIAHNAHEIASTCAKLFSSNLYLVMQVGLLSKTGGYPALS